MPRSNWSLTFRFNHSDVPSTRENSDTFTAGLSTKYVKYYSSGFLSLQTALSTAIVLKEEGTSPAGPAPPTGGLGAAVYAAPYPVPQYATNAFLDRAGPTIGLVLVVSFIPPLGGERPLAHHPVPVLQEVLVLAGSVPAGDLGLGPRLRS